MLNFFKIKSYHIIFKAIFLFLFLFLYDFYCSNLNNSLPMSLTLIDNIFLSISLSCFLCILNLLHISYFFYNKYEFLITFMISSFFLSLIFLISSNHFFNIVLKDYQNIIKFNIYNNENIKMSNILSLYGTKGNFFYDNKIKLDNNFNVDIFWTSEKKNITDYYDKENGGFKNIFSNSDFNITTILSNNNIFNIDDFIKLLYSNIECDKFFKNELNCFINNVDNNNNDEDNNNNNKISFFENIIKNDHIFKENLFKMFSKFNDIYFLKIFSENYHMFLVIVIPFLSMGIIIFFDYINFFYINSKENSFFSKKKLDRKPLFLSPSSLLKSDYLKNNNINNDDYHYYGDDIGDHINDDIDDDDNNNKIFKSSPKKFFKLNIFDYQYMNCLYNFFNIISFIYILINCYLFIDQYNKYNMLSYKSDITGNYVFITFLSLLMLLKTPYFYYIGNKNNKNSNDIINNIVSIFIYDVMLLIYLFINISSLKKKGNNNNIFNFKYKNKDGNIIDETYGFEMSNDIGQYHFNDIKFTTYKWHLFKYDGDKNNCIDIYKKNILYTLNYDYIFNKFDDYPNSFDLQKKYHTLSEYNVHIFIYTILNLCILKHMILLFFYGIELINKRVFYKSKKFDYNISYGLFEASTLSIVSIIMIFFCLTAFKI